MNMRLGLAKRLTMTKVSALYSMFWTTWKLRPFWVD